MLDVNRIRPKGFCWPVVAGLLFDDSSPIMDLRKNGGVLGSVQLSELLDGD